MSADTKYPAGVVQIRQDGNLAVPTGKSIDVESGGALKVAGTDITAQLAALLTAAEMAALTGLPTNVTFAPAAGGANICLVTITVKNAAGAAMGVPVVLDIWLSDAATGLGITGTAASGAVAAGASGSDLAALVSKKMIRIQTTAAGVYILSITDTAKTGFYVCAAVPATGGIKASAQLITGNYG